MEMFYSSGYKKLLHQHDEDLELEESRGSLPPPPATRRYLYMIVALVFVSNVCTWYTSQWMTRTYKQTVDDGRSPYAGLKWDLPTVLTGETLYNHRNETIRDAAWDAINIDAGMIAVPDTFVVDNNLPEAQRFPWDASKSLYLLNGHHSLHCARSIYISLMEFKQGRPQSRRWGHIIHCVDQLRQDSICNADDTPRYSTDDDIPISGLGQVRMCRSWEKLENWAKQYNACYRYINQTLSLDEISQIERYIWCPKGSPYVKEVEKVFGHVEWDRDGFSISEPES